MKLLASLASPYTRKVRVVARREEDRLRNRAGLDQASPFNRLIPTDIREREQVRRWGALADGVVDAGILVRGGFQLEKQIARMHRGMAQLAAGLDSRAWCQGERYSLADIALGCCVGWLGFRKPGDIDWQAKYPPLARHYEKLLERPPFADTIPGK
jgi:glutathione S-transferase